ncbi:ImmA/IrrE family metallo-endopeptidase [Cryobacterium melibiosiphilum]|uniref:ImmA/IrrE family metallo-endopeptidase n=1 Tax=Cryobacterium melibiosiphilum TaxID=995039 RepID=UPI001F3908AB|nr:ImmA/IrrE family metallo-endopeptidase [Cryobacterium melibiosiphilum]
MSAAVDELALGETFTFDELVAAVQRRRQRRLRIVELTDLSDHNGLCAVLLTTDAEDLIVHARSDSVLHRQQFVLHELAHMILGHEIDDDSDGPDFLLPDIPAETRRRLLRRQNLDTGEEVLAEIIADNLAAAIRGSAKQSSRYLEIFG